jgi:hypothetical protein
VCFRSPVRAIIGLSSDALAGASDIAMSLLTSGKEYCHLAIDSS